LSGKDTKDSSEATLSGTLNILTQRRPTNSALISFIIYALEMDNYSKMALEIFLDAKHSKDGTSSVLDGMTYAGGLQRSVHRYETS
jgi:hypothetical protein